MSYDDDVRKVNNLLMIIKASGEWENKAQHLNLRTKILSSTESRLPDTREEKPFFSFILFTKVFSWKNIPQCIPQFIPFRRNG